jgi:hypothetical protein
MLISKVYAANRRTREVDLRDSFGPCERILEHTLRCVRRMPFGTPVLPEVKTTKAGSSGDTLTVTGSCVSESVVVVEVSTPMVTRSGPETSSV